jgi:hypothetical protein
MTTQPNTFQARRDRQVADQAHMNNLYGELGADVAAAEIRRIAAAENAGHAQYDGYWDGPEWILGQAKHDIESKGGDQALAGDIVLMRQEGQRVMFYSVRLGWNCSGSYGPEPLVGWGPAYEHWSNLRMQARAQARRDYFDSIVRASCAAEAELESRVS